MRRIITMTASLILLLVGAYFIMSLSSIKVSFDNTLENDKDQKTWVSRVTKQDIKNTRVPKDTDTTNTILVDLPTAKNLDPKSKEEIKNSVATIMNNFKNVVTLNRDIEYTFKGKQFAKMFLIKGTDEEFAKLKNLKGKTKFEKKLIESINSVQNRYFLGIVKYYEI